MIPKMSSYFVYVNACLAVTCMVSLRLYLVLKLGTASFCLLVKHCVRELSVDVCCSSVWSVFLCYTFVYFKRFRHF
jgi:hypothetical protein